MKKIFIVILGLFLTASLGFTQTNSNTPQKNKAGVKYKKSNKLDFESLLIQGERKRAEIIVVTGDADDDLGGLLRLRENFLDHQAQDFGEVAE